MATGTDDRGPPARTPRRARNRAAAERVDPATPPCRAGPNGVPRQTRDPGPTSSPWSSVVIPAVSTALLPLAPAAPCRPERPSGARGSTHSAAAHERADPLVLACGPLRRIALAAPRIARAEQPRPPPAQVTGLCERVCVAPSHPLVQLLREGRRRTVQAPPGGEDAARRVPRRAASAGDHAPRAARPRRWGVLVRTARDAGSSHASTAMRRDRDASAPPPRAGKGSRVRRPRWGASRAS